MKKRKNEKIEKAKKRSIVYSLRVTESQYEAVTEMAKELRMPVSTYVKELLFNKNFRITESIAVHDSELERLSGKLEEIGKRLNRIMRYFNQGGQSTPEIENEIRENMPMIGWICVATIAQYFKAFEKCIPWIALALLGFIGGKMLYEGIKNKDCEGEKPAVGIGALLIQGVATSIDALSVGFTISDYNWIEALIACLLIGVITFAICMVGIAIGKKAGTCLANKAGIFGGAILIFIGLEIFITSWF